MLLTIVCGVLLLAGLVMIVAWGGTRVQAPPASTDPPESDGTAAGVTDAGSRTPSSGGAGRLDALRRYLWWVTVATVSGVVPGILIAGAGGRLVMRVLALTSPHSTGRLTVAGALVGQISAEGTLALLVFGAIPAGFLSAVLYLCVHRWLPPGRLSGVAFGLLLLLVFATTLDPLRADNPDFGFLGPGWLALTLFGVLVVLQGMLVAAIAGRYSRHLPLLASTHWLAYAPLLAAVVFVPAGVAAVVGAVFVLLFAPILPPVKRWLHSSAATWVMRGALIVLVLVSLPTFINSVRILATD